MRVPRPSKRSPKPTSRPPSCVTSVLRSKRWSPTSPARCVHIATTLKSNRSGSRRARHGSTSSLASAGSTATRSRPFLAYADDARGRLESLENADSRNEALQQRINELMTSLQTACAEASAARRAGAARLSAAAAEELRKLGMPAVRFGVGFSSQDDSDGVPVALPDYEVIEGEAGDIGGEEHSRAFTESGVDRVEFLVSFNPGGELRPLSTVASGGETSRFMLALTTVLGAASPPRTVVLDEVDEGVGGRAGTVVGEALRRLAKRHQVICITHLPQVAAFADAHFVVSKRSDGTSTASEVAQIEGADRERELAMMLGGETEANLAAARELTQTVGAPSR